MKNIKWTTVSANSLTFEVATIGGTKVYRVKGETFIKVSKTLHPVVLTQVNG